MALSITPNLLKVIWIIQHPNTTLARGIENLSQPSAIDAGFLGGMSVVLTIAVVATIGLVFFNNYALGMAQKIERSNALLGRYFAPDVREEIEASDLDLTEQEPKEQLVAILFTDIAGFTKLSEKMDPRNVMRLLSTYQSMMVSSIFAHSGTVDKFIGDAVMANFGTPRSHSNDAQNPTIVRWKCIRRSQRGMLSAGLLDFSKYIIALAFILVLVLSATQGRNKGLNLL